jgi:hypothetical protein
MRADLMHHIQTAAFYESSAGRDLPQEEKQQAVDKEVSTHIHALLHLFFRDKNRIGSKLAFSRLCVRACCP